MGFEAEFSDDGITTISFGNYVCGDIDGAAYLYSGNETRRIYCRNGDLDFAAPQVHTEKSGEIRLLVGGVARLAGMWSTSNGLTFFY